MCLGPYQLSMMEFSWEITERLRSVLLKTNSSIDAFQNCRRIEEQQNVWNAIFKGDSPLPNFLLLYPLEISENQSSSDYFREHRIRTLTCHGLRSQWPMTLWCSLLITLNCLSESVYLPTTQNFYCRPCIEHSRLEVVFFLSGFSFTNIHDSKDNRGRGRLSI